MEKLKFDINKLTEMCNKYGARFVDGDEKLFIANNCGTVSIDKSYTTTRAYLEVVGDITDEDEEYIAEFANSNYSLYMAVAEATIPSLKPYLYNLYQDHNLDAGLNKNYSLDKIHIVTWLSLPTKQFFWGGVKDELKWPSMDFLLVKLNKFTEANTEVYQKAVKEAQEHSGPRSRYDYWKGKELVPNLPQKSEEFFSTKDIEA